MLKKIILSLLGLCLLWSEVESQITCDFTYTDPTGCGGFAVDFCDNSSSTAGNIVAWSWNMEVISSSIECPSTVFSQPGLYTVCLTVTDSQGNTCTECKDDLVQVFNLPSPDFEADITEGCTPLEVTYTDLSQSVDGNIVDWIWGFGGSCGTIQGTGGNPVGTCTYTIPGSYNISLVVTDDNGCINTINKVSYINVSPKPIIDFLAVDTFGCNPPFSTTFINLNNDPNVTYTWDFGNNQSYTGPAPPTITYTESGSYDVSLIGIDQISGCRDTLTFENYINVGYPADFTYTPEGGCEDLTAYFTDNSSYVAQSVLWDFGDGTTSSSPNPTHVFTEPGCFTVTLTRIVDGCTSVVTNETCINVEPEPDVWYANDNNIGCTIPHTVNFSGASVLATDWLWDFGDGTTSTLQNPTHTYTTFGTYPVTLTVTGANGCSNDTTINTINVTELAGGVVTDFYDGCIPLQVTLEDNSTTVSPIISWYWEVQDNGNPVFTSTQQNPTFMIADTGVYDVVLIITNTLGCIDTLLLEEIIEAGDELQVVFEAVPVEACVDQTIQFTDLTIGDIDEWYWNFGDGGNAFEENPEYAYSDTGYYDVSLVVNQNGCESFAFYEDYIHAMAPVAGFSVDNFCDNQLYREFVNSAIGADSTFWNFGVLNSTTDTSSLTNPSFTFPAPGIYTVTQWVYNSMTMCSHQTTREVHITSPEAQFNISPHQGCVPLLAQMEDISIDAIQWQWFSVNGVISDDTLQNPYITYNNPGLYTNDISLVVTDVNGCQDSIVLMDSILVNIPQAAFTSDITTGCAPLEVSFIDLSVNNYFAEVVAWSWDFGPGLGTSTLQNPTFTFQNLGTYDVVLTVTDSWGCTHTTTLEDYVDVTSPVADFVVDTLSCTQHDMPFQSISSGWQLTYTWDFGDGTTGIGSNLMHQYTVEGIYTACLQITDGYGCTDMICKDIEVADPNADFTVDSTFASCPPLPVNFTNFSTNASSYLWDFGDNNAPSDFENPSYVYITPGVFDVTLIAIRTAACQDTLVFDNLIVLDGPVGEYSLTPDTSCVPAVVTFVASSPETYIYMWDFGEGIIDTSATPILYDSVEYVYDSIGTYTPTLSLLNSTGCFRTLPVVSSVYVAGLEVDFEASKTAICNDDPAISFTPTFDATEPITSVEWFFENGNPAASTEMQPIVNFTVPGTHDVMLIIHTELCSDTLLKADYIGVGEVPTASFIMSADEGCEPLTVTFTDNSFVANGTIQQWNWDFGDGTTSTSQNPTHVFGPGVDIAISLEVTSDAGCTDNYFDNALVYALTDIDAGDNVTVCIGEPTQLHGAIYGDTSQVDYYWSPASGLSCTDCLEPWVSNPTDTITYTLNVTNAENCTATAEVTVFVAPYEAPQIVLPEDTTLCAEQVFHIMLDIANNVSIFTYNWDSSVPGLSCYDNCFNPVASPEVTSTYVVTVTTDQGCQAVDSITIGVQDQFQEFAGEDRIICEGDSTVLDATFGANPQWLYSTGLSCAYCAEPIASPDSTTVYIVQVTTHDFGCNIIDSIVVAVLPAEDVGAGEDQVICLGESVELQGFGPGEITWSPTVDLSDPTVLNPLASPTSDIVYTITVVNDECTYTDSVRVEVNEKTELADLDFFICEGEEIAISVEGEADAYQWSPPEEVSDASIANPLVHPSETTTYTVIGTLGLCAPDTAIATVDVTPAPIFYLTPTRYYLEGQSIVLEPRMLTEQPVNLTYHWSPATGLSCIDCETPSVRPEENIIYTLTITDEDTGCTYERSVSVERLTQCSEDLVGVPNAFSPNGDGNNDELQLLVSPTVPQVRLFNIYNRWGGLVYSSNNAYGTWDGKLKGRELDEGVYVYLVQFVCGLDGSLITKKGDITILR